MRTYLKTAKLLITILITIVFFTMPFVLHKHFEALANTTDVTNKSCSEVFGLPPEINDDQKGSESATCQGICMGGFFGGSLTACNSMCNGRWDECKNDQGYQDDMENKILCAECQKDIKSREVESSWYKSYKQCEQNFGGPDICPVPDDIKPSSSASTFTVSQIDPNKYFSGKTVEDYIKDILVALSAALGGLAVLKIMFAGAMYATAAGNTKQIATAKEDLTYAIIGIVLIVGANVILYIFGANVIKLP